MQTAPATRRLARELAAASDLQGFFAANRHRLAPETLADLKEEVDRLVKVDLAKAEPLARAARELAGLLADPVSVGYGDAAIAQVHHYSGRLADALPLYEAAIERLKAAGRSVEAASVERQLVGLLHRQGRADAALEVARRSRRTLRRAGEWRLLAQLESNVGAVYYYVLQQYRKAIKYYDRAQALLVQIGDFDSLAIVEFNRAHVLLELDRPHEAIELYEKAERLHAAAGRRIAGAQCSYMAAFGYATLGRYGDALKRYYSAREQLDEAGAGVSAGFAGLCLAELHLRLNVVDEAESLASTMLERFDAVPGYEAEVARARVLRARTLERRREYDAASDELRKARSSFERLGFAVLAADARLSEAELALALGDVDEAAAAAAEAGEAFRTMRLNGRRARALLVDAEVARARGDVGRSLRRARSAAAAADRAYDVLVRCRAETLLGELELERRRSDVGIALLERAVVGIEGLRTRLRPGEMRAAFLNDKLRPYERLVDAFLDRGDVVSMRRAFRYVEMAKSRALADLMAQQIGGSREETGRASRVRAELARRLEELSWYSSRIEGNSEKGGQRNARLETSLRQELSRCERDLATLFNRLEVEDSRLADLLTAEPPGLEALPGTLEADEALVEFFVSRGRVSAFVVTDESCSTFNGYAELKALESQLSALRFQLEKFALGNSYAATHRAALRRSVDRHLEELHRLLIAPLETLLGGKKLVVVPHGVLHYVPFHALKGAGRYLIEDHEVSYAPSATVHRLCAERDGRNGGEGRLLAVGIGDALTPHIAEELASVAGCFAESVRLEGDHASKNAFLDLAPRSRFLHIATHGFFRQDNPMFSSVRLADGPLNFYDVFDLDLDADLVTLSACNTGLNKLSPGDELSGLMRGFLYAGAPSLMVSLWAVNDRSTSDLMRSFYGHLANGSSKRRALQLAQLEALERYGHPYFWAPFILMGKV